jgi:penicillin-binding protein 1A
VRDPFQSNRKRRRGLRLIEIDAWIDSSLFRAGRLIAGRLEAISRFMRRFRVTGVTRALVELLGEGLTLGAGGAVVMLAFAIPAFHDTSGDWQSRGDLAVTFLDRHGNEIGKRGINQSDSVPLEEMPDYLIKAVLGTEDRRFYNHFGIDVPGTMRALAENLRASAVVQGGSSLTQQLAKNLFLSNERTLERKIKEAFLALWLETHYTKNQILKLYLDNAYMGGGTFGVEAASQYYFGKSVKDINLAEAAMLAGLFKAPSRFAPSINLPAARARANEVLTNMVQAGFMTEGQVLGARRHPADVIEHANDTGSPDYFLDWAFQEVKDLGDLGDRVLVVRTTLDTGIQHAAEDAVGNSLRTYGAAFNVKQGAAVVVSPDGAVRAMIGGRDYGESQFNRATDALRQPGSSFKLFVYSTAMMNGFTPKSIVLDAPICIGNWCPHNYGGGYSGPIPLTTALVKSINVIPVRLAQAFGREKIVETARKMGITTDLRITRSLPLGSDEVKVIEMAGAYAVMANGGYRAKPYAFTQILSSSGKVLYDRRKEAKPPVRALPENVVAEMNSMLVQVPEWGTGRAAKLDGIRTAGKTGTTSDYRDAWFDGFTGNYACVVWFGNDNYTPTRQMTGGSLPARTWHDIMAFAHKGVDLKPIPGIDNPFEKPPAGAPIAAADTANQNATADSGRPATLSAATTEQLLAIEQLMRKAQRLKPLAAIAPPLPVSSAEVAGASPAATKDQVTR